MAAHQIVNICGHLVRGVIERGRAGAEQKQRVVVARQVAAIAAQKRAERLSSGEPRVISSDVIKPKRDYYEASDSRKFFTFSTQ